MEVWRRDTAVLEPVETPQVPPGLECGLQKPTLHSDQRLLALGAIRGSRNVPKRACNINTAIVGSRDGAPGNKRKLLPFHLPIQSRPPRHDSLTYNNLIRLSGTLSNIKSDTVFWVSGVFQNPQPRGNKIRGLCSPTGTPQKRVRLMPYGRPFEYLCLSRQEILNLDDWPKLDYV